MNYFRPYLLLYAIGLWVLPAAYAAEAKDSLSLVYHSVNVITGEYVEAENDLSIESQSPLILRRFSTSEAAPWAFNLPYLFPHSHPPQESQETSHSLLYTYDDDERLSEVRTSAKDSKGDKEWLRFHYLQPNSPDCRIEASNGEQVTYRFQANEKNRQQSLLQAIEKSQGASTYYSYCDHPTQKLKLIARRESSGGGFVINDYYQLQDFPKEGKDSPFVGRIKVQYEPLGSDATPILSHRFVYHTDYTEEYNALGAKTVYRYSEEGLLTAIEHYKKSSDNNTLYRVERLQWHREDANLPSQLISHSHEDENGNVLLCRTYLYDKYGNKIKSTIHGDLSGKCQGSIILDEAGHPLAHQIESYSTSYLFSEGDSSKLLAEVEDNGKTTRIAYEGDLLKAKWISKGTDVLSREFYSYNPQGLLEKITLDDGCAENEEDLSGVTERRITTYRYESAHATQPFLVEEWSQNPTSPHRCLLSQCYHVYNAQGKPLQTDRHDGEGIYISSKYYTYDRAGRLMTSSDHQGNMVQQDYDINGNIICLANLDSNGTYCTARTCYDLAGRPLHSQGYNEKNEEWSQSYRYDLLGNVTASIDSYGNEILFEYDEFNRKIETLLPHVLDEDGISRQPIEKTSYDIFDRVVTQTDAKGYVTYFHYNARGDKTAISYPDGTKESFVYALDGTLEQSINRSGWSTRYYYDAKGRVISQENFSPSGQLETSTRVSYNGFNIASKQDELGIITLYSYDAQGRLIQEECETGEGVRKTSYTYDSADRIATEQMWFGDDASDFTLRRHLYNHLGDPLEIAIENSQGETIKIIPLVPSSSPQKYPLEKLEIVNDRQQIVLQTTQTDHLGVSTISTFDALGRIEVIETKNSMGALLTRNEIRWDLNGNKAQETHFLMTPEGSVQTLTTRFGFGAGNRLESISEVVEGEQEKSTFYFYNDRGQHTTTLLPNGIELHYDYDEKGQLALLYSSDNTCFYRYLYDDSGRPVRIDDCLTGASSSRSYTVSGQLATETLGNGLTIVNTYDRCGQRQQCILPDGSLIDYDYDGVILKAIHRRDEIGQVKYSHHFSEHDLAGRVIQTALIGNAGTVGYMYDEADHIQGITSEHWSEEILTSHEGSSCQVAQRAIKDTVGIYTTQFDYDEQRRLITVLGEQAEEFAYDSLGNRVNHSGNSYRYHNGNQLASEGDGHYLYDSCGNTAEKITPETHQFLHYDALNRLISVEDKNNLLIKFTYDSFNRRLTKSVSSWNSYRSEWIPQHSLKFLYDGNREIGAVDENGMLIQLRVLGEGLGAEIGAAVAIELNSKAYAPIHDHRGSICCLIDTDTQQPAETYRYSSFGEEQIYDAYGDLQDYSPLQNPWRFSSKRAEDECGLIDFGARFYDPRIGRWISPDPLGMIDGPNRYAYLANNPLGHVDPYGYFSLKAAWKSFCSLAIQEVKQIAQSFKQATEFIQHQLSYVQYIKDDIRKTGEQILGGLTLILLGFHDEKPEVGCVGSGELNDKLRITLVHGILNVRDTYTHAAHMVSSSLEGSNVHYVAVPTEGWTWDILKAAAGKMGYLSPQGVQLAETWKRLITDMGGVDGGGTIIHFAHSNGGTQTMAAATSLLTPEELKMIRVIAIGSATVIPDGKFQNSINFVSRRDIVLYLAPIGYLRGAFEYHNLTLLSSFWGIPFVDHLISSPTYSALVDKIGHKIYQHYKPDSQDLPEMRKV